MFRTKLTRLFQIVLLSGMLFSHIEIASAQSTGGGQAQLVEGRAIIVRQGKEMGVEHTIYMLQPAPVPGS